MSVTDTTLRPPDPVDFDKQTTGSGSTRPKMPPQGEFTLLTVDIAADPNEPKNRSKEGYFQPVLTYKVVDPGQPHDNYEMRYQRLSTKKWPNKESNSALDYLRAHGIDARPTTDAEYASLILQTLNRPFRAMVDWRAYDSATQEKRNGMTSFPQRADGSYQPWFTATGGGDTKVFANAEVKFFKTAVA